MPPRTRASDHLVRLSNRTTDVVVDVATGVPTIVHWGAPLGEHAALAALPAALDQPVPFGGLDVVAPVSVVPEHGAGFPGRPGLAGRRGGGRDWSPRFALSTFVHDGNRLEVNSTDEVAALSLTATLELDDALRVRVQLRNDGERRYSLDALTVTLPLPEHAEELVTFGGRWAGELRPTRHDWVEGCWTAENRRGRTSHEHPPLVIVGERGFGEWRGEVWAVHLAWSGNHVMAADRLADGRRYVQAGELLHPGEIVLEPGDAYATPEVVAVHGCAGLTPATWGFHRSLRARPSHPTSPRPVSLNTWEAVYFDHDLDRLLRLADVAAGLGVERFVLDDGWFGSRRDDTRGLGDWWVSSEVHPRGLAPLIDHVHSLGMQFGIWVEPEMVNPDSELYRAHPDWVLATPGYIPVSGRHQLVLDLARAEVAEYLLGHLDALLADHDIAAVKWDMNRPHVQASGADGAAGTHRQTLALYALLDELRRRHPGVEFESCASGGGRIDHEMLRRTERVWTSDCNDALERQHIQRAASLLIPPELMGAHVGPPRAHTTGRTHSLAFRTATAMFGHFGIEWDVAALDARERGRLAAAIELHRRHRALLHGGDVVRFDTDASQLAHGVYAPDRSEALVCLTQLTTSSNLASPPLRLPGLDPSRRYRVEHLPLPGERWGPVQRHPSWLSTGIELVGAQLAAHGIRPPTLLPETAVLFHVVGR